MFIAAGAAGFALHRLTERYDRALTKQELLDPAARRDESGSWLRQHVSGSLNYLLVGTDRRPKDPGGGLADTILIAHVPAGLKRAYLVSVPRDLLAEIPPDGPAGYPGGTDKINSAFLYGGGGAAGARLLSATLTGLTGLRFDGAAIINFGGFRKVIDLLGGVTICVDTEVRSIHTGAVFPVGCHQMGGAQALDYARQRYGLPGGDHDRERHQQQILKAIMQKAGTGGLLANPVRADQLIRALGSAMIVDTNRVPPANVASALWSLRADALVGLQVPTTGSVVDEIYSEQLDPAADSLFAALRGTDTESWVTANPRWVNRI
ncbi:LCP family protein [Micromonospora pattaloongensis]|uniref:LCP family protein n=1 Tax=Micromonospora pattaloongensis TaxID=405436 RepID=UPI003CCBB4D3